MVNDKSKCRFTKGTMSLLLSFVFIATVIPIDLWASQPQYQTEGGALGMGILIGSLIFFLWAPLALSASVTAVLAIADNRGRKEGLITAASLILVFVGLLIQNGMHS